MVRLTGLVLLTIAAVVGTAAQQVAAPTGVAGQGEPPPVIFRSEVNYVEVDAIVTDAAGKVVSDLTQAEFELFEDGKPQKIASFAHIELPIQRPERALFSATAIEPDVRTNQSLEGRVYLLVLDDWHIDITRTPRVKAAARRFIEQNFGTNDIAAVVFTGRNDASQEFTNNRQLLLAAIDRFAGRKLRSATLNRLGNIVANRDGSVSAGADADEQERAYHARSVMGSIRKLSEFLAGVRGRRKAMLLISEGVDYDIDQVMGNEGATASLVLEDTRNAIAAATRGNVAIYTIDPRGLTTPGEELIEVTSTLPEQGLGVASLQNELRLSQQSLRTLAADTGGFAAVNQNDFSNAFDRIVRENSSYYLLGFYPTNDKRDGRLRKLQLRVKRPGLNVRSRSGYLAPRGKAPALPPARKDAPLLSVTEAISSPLPVTGLPMRVFAAAFKGTAPNAAIAFAIDIDGSRLDFVNRNGLWAEKLEILNTALDSSGKSFLGDHQKLDLTLKPDTYQRVVERGLRVVSQTELPPGRYQLRFAVGTPAGKSGSVLYDLEVPDFTKGALRMSGVALTSAFETSQSATVRPKDPLRDYLPGPPVATREFRQGDTLILFAEAYENIRGGQTHQVALKTEVRADDGRVVAQTSEQRSSTELQGRAGGYGFTARVPLAGIAPGIYVIHVEAQAQYEGLPTASRDIQIRVNP
jgi:VWFA-related protein